MGSCTSKKTSQQQRAKQSGSFTTYDSPTKIEGRSNRAIDKAQQEQLPAKGSDKYEQKFGISQAQFKEEAIAKAKQYYDLFLKFSKMASQIGEVDPQIASARLCKSLNNVKIIREKVERDFQLESYNRKIEQRPISDMEVLILTFKYAQVMVDVFSTLEKDQKYEELFPILSFSFKDINCKLKEILSQAEELKKSSKRSIS